MCFLILHRILFETKYCDNLTSISIVAFPFSSRKGFVVGPIFLLERVKSWV